MASRAGLLILNSMPTITRITISVADVAPACALYKMALGILPTYELPGMRELR
jgi:hypothetical protein